MTKLLYMDDFNVEDCNSTVVSIGMTEDGRTEVILDQTCFYPRGGGQDWDTGSIGSFQVSEVRMDPEGVVHHIGDLETDLKADDEVKCQVDHDRRAVNMRLHSAAHVIDMAVAELDLDWIATKGQHYPHLCAVEYSGTWDPEQVEVLKEKIESISNELIEKGSSNRLEFVPVEKMHELCRHVPENIPKNKPGRVVMYGEDFGIPCGGTHLKDIADVGKVNVNKLKQKKGVIRLSYSVEGIN